MKDGLIQKFFRKECTPEEVKEVLEYLNSNPEALDQHLDKSEWDEIEAGTGMPKEFWDEVWRKIQKEKRANAGVIWLKRSAVAALITGVILLGFLAEKKKGDNELPAVSANKVITPAVETKVVANTSNKKLRVVLPDNSIVELSQGAILKYSVLFNEKRDIELVGKGNFKVTADKARPFTVYAGGLATTALGTEFGITAINGLNKISVQLFEGKVVVRAIDHNMKGWTRDVYLSAGEQLRYDIGAKLVAVEKIKTADEHLPATKKLKIKKHPSDDVSNDLVFTSSSLPEVMEQLSKYFNTRISYNKAEISEKNFTGNISRKDSLPVILKLIAQMNDLQISTTDSGFVVEKLNDAIREKNQIPEQR
jgi:transmembrane sensor